MHKTLPLLAGAALLALGVAQAQPPQAPQVEPPATTRPLQARPVQKPQATSDRDKAGATGYHDKDQDEPTQERPNPLDARPVETPQATSDRARAGATGYDDDPGEETQGRPNPLNSQPVQVPVPQREPAGMQQRAPAR